jgi:DNA (cytosine-5)-methyltransferase 1
MKGLKPDSGTRSSLLWENIRLLKTAKENDTLPKYLMFENVKNLVSKKFIDDFNNLLDVLDELGFNSYWEVINGKDCGVPQNRERVFVISIRKDIDTKQFTFPKPFDNGVRLKDILEKTVEDKYYLSKEIQDRFKITDETFTKNIVGTTKPDFRTIGQRDLVYQQNSIMGALVATDYKQPKQIIDTLEIYEKPTIQKIDILQTVKVRKYPVDCKALCQCLREHKSKIHLSNNKIAAELNVPLTKVEHWFRKDKCFAIPDADIWVQLKTILNIITDEFDKAIMTFEEREGVYEKSERHYLTNGIAPTLTCATANEKFIEPSFKIRKLTPRECYKLMGLSFKDCDKAYNIGVADTYLYKQAGNGIITNCVKLIAEHLYKAQYDNTYVCEDEMYNDSNFIKP